MSAGSSLSRQDWIEGGFRALREEGVEVLGVEPLAKRMGVTKGSFYHHFENRRALQVAMVESWAEAGTNQVITEVEAEADDPADRLRALGHVVFPVSSPEDAIESAMRAWAALDPDVAAAVTAVDDRRLSFVAGLLRANGLPRGLAQRRARLLYRALIGEFTWRAAGGPSSTRTEIDELTDLILTPP